MTEQEIRDWVGENMDAKLREFGARGIIRHMARSLNLTGQRFGRLVVAFTVRQGRSILQVCMCDCGATKQVLGSALKMGRTQSCGCLRSETVAKRNRTHSGSSRPEYKTWAHIIQRCTNPNAPHWADYGGRGISVCDRWASSFEAFFEEMGERPSSRHSIDRINVNGDYEPNNCRWVTQSEQCNNKRNNRRIAYAGESLTLTQWATKIGMNADCLRGRLDRGWAIEDAITKRSRATNGKHEVTA